MAWRARNAFNCISSKIRSGCGMRMPRDVTGEQAVRALRRPGFEEVRQTGSPRILRQGVSPWWSPCIVPSSREL